MSIYDKLLKIKNDLNKAKLSDEHDPFEDDGLDSQDDTSSYVDEESGDTDIADDWLKENDPNFNREKGDDYEEYNLDEDEGVHQQDEGQNFESSQARGSSKRASQSDSDEAPSEEASSEKVNKKNRFRQPSKEELQDIREYTIPYSHRLKEHRILNADPAINPVLGRQANMIEARNLAHKDRDAALNDLISSDEYKNANRRERANLELAFKQKWDHDEKHIANSLMAHGDAHNKSAHFKDLFDAKKEADVEHVLRGGQAGGETFSVEEGLQHAGGAKGEEGTVGAIQQDPAAAFAASNPEFIREYEKNFNERKAAREKKLAAEGKEKVQFDEYYEHPAKDVTKILGAPPKSDQKFQEFFNHYHPLIGMNKKKVLDKLGLDRNHEAGDMLDFAGLQGLIHAINTYDHDHPSKAAFTTHASHQIRGHQLAAAKQADKIPNDIRRAHADFMQQRGSQQSKSQPTTVNQSPAQSSTVAAPVQQKNEPKQNIHSIVSESKHPGALDMADRLKRVGAARTVVRRQAGAPKPQAPQINIPSGIDEEED